MLTGLEIEKRMQEGQIAIRPFVRANMNPNSYNLTLGGRMLCWYGQCNDAAAFDAAKPPPPPDYTINFANRENRFHRTAGFGDTGFCGKWTLEMTVVRPLWVYGGMKVCQIYYLPAVGEVTPYAGKYQGQTGATASRMALEMSREARCQRPRGSSGPE